MVRVSGYPLTPKTITNNNDNNFLQAENELRLSQSEFDRQAEITKLLMEGLSQSQTNHVRHLKAFVAAQVEYYAQAHLVMQDLNREINRLESGIDEPGDMI